MESGTDATQGFEFYSSTGGTGTLSSDTTISHTGPRSIKAASGAGSGAAWARKLSVGTAAGTRASVYLNFTSFSTLGTSSILAFRLNSTTSAYLAVTTGGVLQLFGSAQCGSNGSTLSTGRWYRIGYAFTVTSTTVNEFRVYVDGNLDITASNCALPGNSVGSLYLGLGVISGAGANTIVNFDDIYVDDSSALTDPGDIRVTAKRPNANGTTNVWTATGTGSGYGTGNSVYVNERPLSTASYLSTTGAASEVEEYSIEGASVGDVNITGATLVDYMGWVYANASASLTANMILNNSASAVSLTITNTMFTKVAGSTIYPSGGTVIGMDAGTAAGTKSMYETGVMFAYLGNTAPSAPSSLGPAGLVNGSFGANNTPTPTFTLSDPDASDTVKYQIQIDDTSDFSSPVVDYTSALAAQGATSFTVGQAAGSGTYTTGTAGQTLADGSYYWRVKAIDNSAAASAYSTANAGAIAFKVDTTAPSAVSGLASTSHTASTWSADNTIDVSWTAATDTGGSGVAGYSYLFDTAATTTPDTVQDGTLTSTTSAAQSDGNSIYFHVRAKDNAGNAGSAVHLGPFYVDTTAPTIPGTPSTTTPTNNNTPTWSFTASTDASSGLHATTPYSVQWCTNSLFTGCSSNTSTASSASFTHSTVFADGTWYLRALATDAASNNSSYSQNGSVVVDTTAPSISSVSSSPSSSGATITWVTNENASSKVDYGFTISYGSTTSETDTSPRVSSHSVALSGLVSCATYHYRVRSIDSVTNETIDSDNTFTTSCTGSASIRAQKASSITTTDGGTVGLTSGGSGVTLTVPASFALSDAEFQIKQLDTTSVLNTASIPSGYSAVGSYIYDLKALSGVGTQISSFNRFLTITISYASSDISSSIDETSLRIYRYDGSNWNELSGCRVNTTSNTVTCTTTAFSVFGLFGQTFSSSSSLSSASSSSCSDTPSGSKAPWLYAATPYDGNSITLYFTDAEGPLDKYVLEYGTSSNNYQFGSGNIGGKETRIYNVQYLLPNTTYYFRVRAGNGCATGNWSNEIFATTKGLISTNQLEITSSKLIPQPNSSEEQTNAETPETETQKGYDVKVKVVDKDKKPVEGAKVTIHSKVQEAVTNKDGIAEFKNVEAGDHRVLIAYNNFEGEQSINLTGNVKEFDLNVTAKPQAILFSKEAIGVIAVLLIVIVGLILYVLKLKKKQPK